MHMNTGLECHKEADIFRPKIYSKLQIHDCWNCASSIDFHNNTLMFYYDEVVENDVD